MRGRHRGTSAAVFAVALLLLMGTLPTTHLTESASASLAPRPASMGFAGNEAAPLASTPPTPTYDEQIGVTFTQDFPSLSYNVTALAQTDIEGYGPAYILNGLTNAGYWYQTGVSYHWPSEAGGYEPGFQFSYEVFGPNGQGVFPLNGGAGLVSFSGTVNSGDTVLLSLTFFGNEVEMSAVDQNTGASGREVYQSFGASEFIGEPSRVANDNGYFSGPMTEWYHVSAYTGNEGKVVYSNTQVAVTSAWMWIDEFVPLSKMPPLFDNQTSGPVTFSNPQQIYPFASNGATVYGSQYMFITGQLNTSSSRIDLLPATASTSLPSFTASYTLLGEQQTEDIGGGTNAMVEADPGTEITVTVNSTSLSASTIWAFSTANGSSITFPAGQNVTYVYYELVQEALAYKVAGHGSPIPSSATVAVNYEGAPAAASDKNAPTSDQQAIGTSPVTILAVVGSIVGLNGSIAGSAGQRWTASQNWTVYSPNTVPNPIPLYEQYQVNLSYSVIGGGALPEAPVFNSTSFGTLVSMTVPAQAKQYWLDAGSTYNFTDIINSTVSGQRWADYGANGMGAPDNSFRGIGAITSPDQTITEDYVHQYLADLYPNDSKGGTVVSDVDQAALRSVGVSNPVETISQNGGLWFAAGSTFNATANALQGWKFEGWQGHGAGSYNGTDPNIQFSLTSPLFTEGANFYVRLSISAGTGAEVSYSYASQSGSVPAGTASTIYVPPSSNVTLKASPSLILYSFTGWKLTGQANTTRPSTSLVVDSPTTVTATSSLSYPVVLGSAAVILVLVLAVLLSVRARRRKGDPGIFTPG